jgi:Na+-transporting methylmalonyl-CoA/oxaloacetate decarboxylase gamma subunit
MFGSVVLDVAIGMGFVYLLLSLIASVIQEMLATFMQLRPANLLKGLHSHPSR